jgi:hypothetical protein
LPNTVGVTYSELPHLSPTTSGKREREIEKQSLSYM